MLKALAGTGGKFSRVAVRLLILRTHSKTMPAPLFALPGWNDRLGRRSRLNYSRVRRLWLIRSQSCSGFC